jgi:hypothetical protein
MMKTKNEAAIEKPFAMKKGGSRKEALERRVLHCGHPSIQFNRTFFCAFRRREKFALRGIFARIANFIFEIKVSSKHKKFYRNFRRGVFLIECPAA